ncbi:MAG: aldo/keto reductase [Sebaldella sp.]|nr:aldo/keto reductase [Sebaldella sp.]
MKKIAVGGLLEGTEVSLGCMRMNALSIAEAESLLKVSMNEGITFFDHADIYGQGVSEEIFGTAVKNAGIKREDMILQTKCGIRKGFFDFSKEHIINSVEKSLKRLQTDYVDTLLLHRPDTLVEPEEVSEAFNILHKEGKVKYFGVSNQNPYQIELLQKYVGQKLIINQLQFGIMHTGMIDAGINVNMTNDVSIVRDGSILDYCRLKDITIQAWSPYQYGFFDGVFLDNEKFPELNKVIDKIAKEKGVSNVTIATAWILRHPAKMQVIVGTMNEMRLKEVAKASNVVLTREEWYEIYIASGHILP